MVRRLGCRVLFGMPPEKANDDRIGRALDAFFEQRHSILANLALRVAGEFNVPLGEIHYDPTHILFAGEYEDSVPRSPVKTENEEASRVLSDAELQPAHITKGRTMDDAPRGTVMTHVGLGTYVERVRPATVIWSYRQRKPKRTHCH